MSKYIRLKKPPSTIHYCDPPGWWNRLVHGARGGAIWQCDCGQKWEFVVYYSWGDIVKCWKYMREQS